MGPLAGLRVVDPRLARGSTSRSAPVQGFATQLVQAPRNWRPERAGVADDSGGREHIARDHSLVIRQTTPSVGFSR